MKISICIATYNGEKYILEQLQSILHQLSSDDEVIISDDNSTDSTLLKVKSIGDPRIKIFSNKGSSGVVNNFNNALLKCSGDIIFIADQDDVWLDNRIAQSVKYLKTYDAVLVNCSVTDENLNIIQDSYFEFNNSGKGFFKNLYRSSYLGCCLALNRRVLDFCLPIPPNLLMFHDWWFGILFEIKFKVYFETEPLILYRRHGATSSNTGVASSRRFYEKVHSRFQLCYLALCHVIRNR